jgi:hypothetical protein
LVANDAPWNDKIVANCMSEAFLHVNVEQEFISCVERIAMYTDKIASLSQIKVLACSTCIKYILKSTGDDIRNNGFSLFETIHHKQI